MHANDDGGKARDDARREIAERFAEFWADVDAWHEEVANAKAARTEPPAPPVRGMRVTTGISKTEEAIASFVRRGGGRLIYSVDRHRLGENIVDQFTELGVSARVFRGREAEDPENPGKAMCLNLPAVRLAVKLGDNVARSCCKDADGEHECKFLHECGYRLQATEEPDVWVVPHDMLFHWHRAFGEPTAPVALIIDETMLWKGLRGIERDEAVAVSINSLRSYAPKTGARYRLAQALSQQRADGGVQRAFLVEKMKLRPEDFEAGIDFEWGQMPTLGLEPGMSRAEVRALAKSEKAEAIRHTRRVIKILEAARDMVADPNIEVSGRLTLGQKNGDRIVQWRDVAPINKRFRIPTLLLDATLPDVRLLRAYFPQVEVVADMRVAMPPHTRIRQVRLAPTSARNLAMKELETEAHVKAVVRYVLLRWVETGRQATLVICQKGAEARLRERLPASIHLRHYNDIAGDDQYRGVRLLVLVGRTAPGPREPEMLAGALTGRQPRALADGAVRFTWYERRPGRIRLRDGGEVATQVDYHPDPDVEAVRWLITEGQLVQAMGRARGVNRTAASPVDIDQLFDLVLPLAVDSAPFWCHPSTFAETAAEGVMLTSPTDLMRVWPEVWANRTAAKRALAEGVPTLPSFTRVAYQVAGPDMKRRAGWFDLALIPDPRAWLTERLGPLAVCEFTAVTTGKASAEGRATAHWLKSFKENPLEENEPVLAAVRFVEVIALFRRAAERRTN